MKSKIVILELAEIENCANLDDCWGSYLDGSKYLDIQRFADHYKCHVQYVPKDRYKLTFDDEAGYMWFKLKYEKPKSEENDNS